MSDDKANVRLCNLEPRVESLLQSTPVNWQSLDEADAVQLQSGMALQEMYYTLHY